MWAGVAAGISGNCPRGVVMNVNNVGASSPIQKTVITPVQKQVPADAPKQLRATDRLERGRTAHRKCPL